MGVAKTRRKFLAMIQPGNKQHRLGVFDTVEQAQAAYLRGRAESIREAEARMMSLA